MITYLWLFLKKSAERSILKKLGEVNSQKVWFMSQEISVLYVARKCWTNTLPEYTLFDTTKLK